jgi:superfamily I DNA/RNA helicase
MACPGSGKTRVLVERTVALRRSHPHAHIIVVTFTRQAAAELRRRLEEQLTDLADIRVATFHSLALQQWLGANRARIVNPHESLALLRLAAQAHLPDKQFREFQAAADAYTSGDESALDTAGFQSAYDAYLELLAEHTAVDFGHGVLKTVQGMEDGSLATLPCDFLLVDEVQDIDPTQVRWVLAHTQAGAQLTIVGDDDQSIYGFRAALGVRGMTYMQKHHDAQKIQLVINYRSHQEILRLAVALINRNRIRVAKELTSAKGPGGSVKLHARYWTDRHEDDAIASHLLRCPGKWAVIARTNRKLDRIAHALRAHNIAFSRPGRTAFWESEEPALFLRLLEPGALSDRLTRATVAARAASGAQAGQPGTDALQDLERRIRARTRAHNPTDHITQIATWLQHHVGGLAPNRIAASRQVIEQCKHYLSDMDGSLDTRIAQCRRPRSSKEEDIVLTTMHAAKGLEYPNVWIAGIQDGVVPNSRGDLEEERRLLYVAMTRAERCLHLSFAWNQQITPFERSPYLKLLTPSRFLVKDLALPIPDRAEVAKRAA